MLQSPLTIWARKFIPKRLQRGVYLAVYYLVLTILRPVNYLLVFFRRHSVVDGSVLHISYPVHTPFYTVEVLRKHGVNADYLAVNGIDPQWHKFDHYFLQPAMPWTELFFFWKVIARYEIIHTHFGIMPSLSCWEVPVLKKLGRKIVVHYRGCEARDREINMARYPDMNICQDCDYHASKCRAGKKVVRLYNKYADESLVTTPDMQDFMKNAIHAPFIAPLVDYDKYSGRPKAGLKKKRFKVVHATNHPGIEGTRHIIKVMESLKEKGFVIDFVYLQGVPHENILEELSDADLSIGKMKMGYYANAQIESMFLDVPAITYIRPEFITSELVRSGFIICHPDDLEKTLIYYLENPEALQQKRNIARRSILKIHDNDRLAAQLIDIYRRVREH